MNSKFTRIAIYFVIALSTSVIFRLQPFELPKFNFSDYVYGLLGGTGPFLGAITVLSLFKNQIKNEMTYKGFFSWGTLLLLFLLPTLLFGIMGSTTGSHTEGLLLGLYIAIYAVLEERGWRGYLQSEFINTKPILKYLIISIFWYCWHLTFLGKTSFQNELIIFGILFLSSIGIGVMADRTKSILFAACFHMIGNILAFSSELSDHLGKDTRNLAVAVSVVVWLVVFFIVRKRKASPSAV
jgi:membrane protease YdiL (CAAX protease family)